jgi:UDP-N-acetylmuramate-alanine ligase
VGAADVAMRTVHAGGRATAFLDLPSIVDHAMATLREGDVVVTMGAGDVDGVAHGLRDRLR